MDDTAALDALIDRAYVSWTALSKRMPSRSHPRLLKSRKEKPAAVLARDVLAATNRAGVAPEPGNLVFPDDDDDDGGPEMTGVFDAPPVDTDAAPGAAVAQVVVANGDGTAATGVIPSEDLQVKVGPFRGLDGYTALPKPTGTRADWAEALRDFKWPGHRVAHIFPDKWATASMRRKPNADEIGQDGAGFYGFYYSDVQEEIMHNLDLNEWGITKSWVILKKDETAPSPREKPRMQTRRGAGAASTAAR